MIYETKRLFLRPWHISDAEALYPHASDPLVGPPAGWPPHTSVENSREIIRSVLSAEGTYAVVLKATGLPVGSIGIMPIANKPDEKEIGYWIGRPHWGQGLIPEAVQECLRICFAELHCRRVWCAYFDGNEKSRRVQEKCGFRYHHTEYEKEVPMLEEFRTEHVQMLEKQDWLADHFRIEPGYDAAEEIRPLFEAYIADQLEKQPDFRGYLTQQRYDDELLHPEEKYGLPHGRLYLLRFQQDAIGCIALRRIDAESCELKRLYIVPKFRGLGFSHLLTEQIIQDARQIGYRRILLDTFPFMHSAIALYKSHGFQEIPSYNGSPMENLIYLQLDL